MGISYETPPKSGIQVLAGQTRTIRVQFPARSFISKVVIEQYLGTLVNFTTELFNHRDAMEGTEESSSASDAESSGPVPLRLYKVGPALPSNGPGYLEYFSDSATGGHGLSFFSQDGPAAGRQGVVQRTLYVRITVPESGDPTQDAEDKRFALIIGGEIQIAGV